MRQAHPTAGQIQKNSDALPVRPTNTREVEVHETPGVDVRSDDGVELLGAVCNEAAVDADVDVRRPGLLRVDAEHAASREIPTKKRTDGRKGIGNGR
jgi:hypothetical protein